VRTSSGPIPDQARESESDDIPTLLNDPESGYSVSDDDLESHDNPDLEEDHEGAVESEHEESIGSEEFDALHEIEIGAGVSGVDEVQSSSEYPSLPPRSSSRARRYPKEWRAFQAETLKFHSTQEPDVRIPIAVQNCHILDTSESDSPSLKYALASPSRDLLEIAIAEELGSLREDGKWDIVEPSRGAKIYPSKLVLKVKENMMEHLNFYKHAISCSEIWKDLTSISTIHTSCSKMTPPIIHSCPLTPIRSVTVI
jgi:hypothetical protein